MFYQHHHPNKLFIAMIVHQIHWTLHKIHIHKVRAHTSITGNKIADVLADEGKHKGKPATTPHIHITHTAPYWLASCMTTTHNGAIHNLHTFTNKEHWKQEFFPAKNKIPCVDKWLSNDQINHKPSNHFSKATCIFDAQIMPILKFQYAQYMGNHRKIIFWPSPTQTPTTPYAPTMPKTHGPTSYPHVRTNL